MEIFSHLKRFQVSPSLRLRSPILAHMAHWRIWRIWRTQLVLHDVFYLLTAVFCSVSPLSRAHMAHWRI